MFNRGVPRWQAVATLTLATAAFFCWERGGGAGGPKRDGAYILNDLGAAQAEAKKTGKPIFLVFRCER